MERRLGRVDARLFAAGRVGSVESDNDPSMCIMIDLPDQLPLGCNFGVLNGFGGSDLLEQLFARPLVGFHDLNRRQFGVALARKQRSDQTGPVFLELPDQFLDEQLRSPSARTGSKVPSLLYLNLN